MTIFLAFCLAWTTGDENLCYKCQSKRIRKIKLELNPKKNEFRYGFGFRFFNKNKIIVKNHRSKEKIILNVSTLFMRTVSRNPLEHFRNKKILTIEC
jgi:hypothetical protein